MKKIDLLLVVAAACLSACGGGAPEEHGEVEVGEDALVANSEVVCPANTSLNPDYRVCENGEVAVGPFPDAMVAACKASGARYCYKAYWPVEVAHELRGTDYCPAGTTLDDDLGVCATVRFAYGPFDKEMIAYCREHGGGGECFAMEWRREWMPTPADLPEAAGEVERDETPPVPALEHESPPPPRPVSRPPRDTGDEDDGDDAGEEAEHAAQHANDTPIAPESSSCHAADGYVAGGKTRICVVTVDGKLVEKETARAYRRMQAAAREDGVTIAIVSGFRTMQKQRELYALYQSGRGNLAARPGYSNHQSGTALDLNARAKGVLSWLNAHGREHGFRRTVPSENWHWDRGG